MVSGTFVIGVSTDFELQHQCTTTDPGDGLGRNSTIVGTTEVYSVVDVIKVA